MLTPRQGLLALIIFLACAIRLYRLPEMAPFDFDQEYAANFAYRVLNVYPIQLIGQGLSVQGLFMGPLYFYFLVPFYALFNLHPIGGTIGSIVLGIITIVTYFFVVKQVFGNVAGLIAAFLRASLFSYINTDWSVTPAFSSDLIALITWFCFYKYWQGQHKYLILLGLIFGMYTSMHPILFPFYIVFLILFLIKRQLPKKQTIFLSLLTFLIPLSPLLIFEYLHNFLEVKLLFSFFSSTGGEISRIPQMIIYAQNIFTDLASNLRLPIWFSIVYFTILFFLIYKKIGFWKNQFHLFFLLSSTVVFLLYYSFFPKIVPEYYFAALTTTNLIYFSANLSLLYQKRSRPILLISLVLITYLNLNYLRHHKWDHQNTASLYNKEQIVKKIKNDNTENNQVFVSYIKLPGRDFGFSYLLNYYQIKLNDNAQDPIYTIVVPISLSPDSIDFRSGDAGVIFPSNSKNSDRKE